MDMETAFDRPRRRKRSVGPGTGSPVLSGDVPAGGLRVVTRAGGNSTCPDERDAIDSDSNSLEIGVAEVGCTRPVGHLKTFRRLQDLT